LQKIQDLIMIAGHNNARDQWDFTMIIRTCTLEECGNADGIVVVIDVCRAFSTAAYAFASGAEKIILASSVEEALEIKKQTPGSLTMGEVGGLRVEQFDLWNSPVEVSRLDLSGKTLVQRTSAGTQGMVRSLHAERLLAGSFVVAGATIRFLQNLNPERVTFVITSSGEFPVGVEDKACADYMSDLLIGETPDPGPYLERARDWRLGKEGKDPNLVKLLLADLELCLDIDHFDFIMEAKQENGLLIMTSAPLRYEGGQIFG
jgi:2-phosphosulfolactate phosphatase